MHREIDFAFRFARKRSIHGRWRLFVAAWRVCKCMPFWLQLGSDWRFIDRLVGTSTGIEARASPAVLGQPDRVVCVVRNVEFGRVMLSCLLTFKWSKMKMAKTHRLSFALFHEGLDAFKGIAHCAFALASLMVRCRCCEPIVG